MNRPEKPESSKEKDAEVEDEGQRGEESASNKIDNEEVTFLNKLEIKIRECPSINDIVSSIIDDPKKASEKDPVKKFKEKEPSLFEWITNNIDRMVLLTVKHEKGNIVDFLIKLRAKVNMSGGNETSAADHAYTRKYYKILLSLLKADSFFPVGFNLSELGKDDDDDVKEIKNLVDKRNNFHEVIKNGEVEDVKNLTLNDNSTLYLNSNNESAAYIALKWKKFTTYAYLKSIGATFGKDDEKGVMSKFERKENVALTEAMDQYFPKVSDAHIHYLLSKSRSHKPIKSLDTKLKNYYSILNKISEVSIIFKVLQYSDYLDIIFDFDEDDISQVYPLKTPKDSSRGETAYKIGRIYIAAGLKNERTKEKVLGTIAHELTHMAMQILFENDCNPYRESDQDASGFFEDFKKRIREMSGDPSEVLLDAILKYEPNDHDSELIVRVPHILAQFKKGRDWLENQAPELLNFYKEKIVPKCEKFIHESVILKPKSMIKSINESIGEMSKLKKCNAFFDNAFNHFQNNDNKIFVVKVESTLLGLIKVLQSLYGKAYVNFHSQFLVLKFENFVRQLKDICQAFLAEGCDWLVIEVSQTPTEKDLAKIFEQISELLTVKPYKKLIFVALRNVMKCLRDTLEEFGELELLHSCDEIPDDHLSFKDLDHNSQEQILKKKVTFQGKPIALNKLLHNSELYNFINPEIIESLLVGEKVNVGNKILGLSCLEGPYGDVMETMDFEVFISHVRDSNATFIVRTEKSAEVVEYFNNNVEKKWINIEFQTNSTYDVEMKVRKDKSSTEKIILVNNRFERKHFKNFCQINPREPCYLIVNPDLETNSFTLQEFYNPKFYLKRNVKIKSIKAGDAKRLIRDCRSETFVFSNVSKPKKYFPEEYSNAQCLDEAEAEKNFKKLSKPGKNVHWFKFENRRFFWKDSYGSLTELGKAIDKIKEENKKSLEKVFWRSGKRVRNGNTTPAEYDDSSDDEEMEMEDVDTELTEDDFISELIQKRILLIADNPGNGKTTTLTALYEAKPIADKHWIIRINLRNHIKTIKEESGPNALNLENFIRFLQKLNSDLNTELNENLLKIALTTENKFSKCLLLAFDGFDEMLDFNDRQNVKKMLKFLKNETFCKIWITTRVQYKYELEMALENFAVDFQPLNVKTQKLFIKQFLKDRLHLILRKDSFCEIFDDKNDSKISVFSEGLVLQMNAIFPESMIHFIGIPLQLNLILHNCFDYFKSWSNKEEVLNFACLGNNVLTIYENFIKEKYRVYFRKVDVIEKARQKQDEKLSENYNKNLAESLIHKSDIHKPEGGTKEIILLVGLIQSQNNENDEFIHFTFREYYFAQSFAQYIFKDRFPFEKMLFLFKEILIKPKFQIIRTFLNLRINEKPSENKLEELQSLLSADILQPYTSWDSALAVTAQEGLVNILKLICWIHFQKTSFNVTSILNRTLFHAAVVGGESEYCTTLWNISKDFSTKKWENVYYKALLEQSIHVATRMHHWKLINKVFLKIIEESFSENEIPIFLSKLNTAQDLFRDIDGSNDSFAFLTFFLNMGIEFLSEEERKQIFNTQNLSVTATLKDSRFMRLFVDKCKDVMGPEEDYELVTSINDGQDTILQDAVRDGNSEIVKLILSEIQRIPDVEKQAEYMLAEDDTGLTALYAAVEENHVDVVKVLIEKGEEILSKENFLQFMIIYDINQTFQVVPYNQDNTESLIVLYEKGETIMSNEDWSLWLMTTDETGETILHTACFYNDSKMVSFIVSKLRVDEINRLFLMKTTGNSTCLHDAVHGGTTEFLKLIFDKIEEFLYAENQCELMMTTSDDMNSTTFLEHAVSSKANVEIIELLIEKIHRLLDPEKILEFFTMNDCSNTLILFEVMPMELIKSLVTKNEILSASNHFYAQLFNNNVILTTISNQDDRVTKFIFDQMEENFNEDKREFFMKATQDGRTCFHLAAEKNREDLLTFFFEKAEKILSKEDQTELFLKKDNSGNTLLHTAIKNPHPENVNVLQLLLIKMEKILSTEEIRKLLTMTNISNQSLLHLVSLHCSADKVKLMSELILKKTEDVLTSEQMREFLLLKDNFGGTFPQSYITKTGGEPSFLLEISKKMLKPGDLEILIMEIWHKLLSNGLNELHKFLEQGGLHQLLICTEKALPIEKEREILMMMMENRNNNSQATLNEERRTHGRFGSSSLSQFSNQIALHGILNSKHVNYETVTFLLEKLETILTPEAQNQLFTSKFSTRIVRDFGRDRIIDATPLHNAIMIKEMDEIKLVFHQAEKMLKQNFQQAFMLQDGEMKSILQLAVTSRKYDVAYFIINEANRIFEPEMLKKFLMMTDASKQTVLHLAVYSVGSHSDAGSYFKHGSFHFKNIGLKDTWMKWKIIANFMYSLLKETEKLFTPEEQRQFFMMKDKYGNTALHDAAKSRIVEAVKLLLQNAEKCFIGEDLKTFVMERDDWGQTAFEWKDHIYEDDEDNDVEIHIFRDDLITEFVEEKIELKN